jgi:hypothetical protein
MALTMPVEFRCSSRAEATDPRSISAVTVISSTANTAGVIVTSRTVVSPPRTRTSLTVFAAYPISRTSITCVPTGTSARK